MYRFGFQNLLNENFHVYIRNFRLLGQIIFVCFEMGSHYVALTVHTGLILTEVCLSLSPECVTKGMFHQA